MAFKFFTVPMQGMAGAEAELNAFLRSHKILSVDRRWVDQGPSSFWSLCIDYLENNASGYSGDRSGNSKGKIDYKEVLRPEEFTIYAKLRDLRKEIAQQEAVPVYTIFTNEQLAKMVQTRVHDQAELAKIDGVGGARLEKYGARVIELLALAWKKTDETGGKAP